MIAFYSVGNMIICVNDNAVGLCANPKPKQNIEYSSNRCIININCNNDSGIQLASKPYVLVDMLYSRNNGTNTVFTARLEPNRFGCNMYAKRKNIDMNQQLILKQQSINQYTLEEIKKETIRETKRRTYK